MGAAPRGALEGPGAVSAASQVFVDDLDALEISEEDEHHLDHVLRLGRGEVVIACDGTGTWRTCRYGGRSRSLEPDGPIVHEPPAARKIAVGFVPVKGERPEWVVQKLTELGVDQIALLRSARSVVQWERARETKAMERLRKISRQAAAQSRRAWLPELNGVVSLSELRESLSPEPLALAEPGGGSPAADLAALAVGPEGGWDPSELEGAGRLVGLGQGILRAETAAVAAGFLLCALRDRIVVASRGPTVASEAAGRAHRC